MMLQALIRV